MLRLENIDYLYALLLIPLFVLIYIVVRQRRKAMLSRYGDTSLINSLYPEASVYKPLLKFILLMAGLLFLDIGIANPQIGTKLEEAKRKGGDVIVAIDVSNSMLAKDKKGDNALSRLDLSKHYIGKLIDKLEGDKIGFVVFAGEASVHLPLTTDYSAAKMFLSTIDPDLIPTQGTAFAKALDLAMTSFVDEETDSLTGEIIKLNENDLQKTLIIITDGENHEKDALEYAAKAANKGLVIHTIGMGSPGGSLIPVYKNGKFTGDYMKDKDGKPVMTKLNDQMLSQIASIGNGQYLRASDGEPDLALLVHELGKMEQKEFDKKKYSEYEDRFQYFIAIAIFFLFIETIFSERKNKLLTVMNLFGEK